MTHPRRRKTDKPLTSAIRFRVLAVVAAVLIAASLAVIVTQIVTNTTDVDKTSTTVQSTAETTRQIKELQEAIATQGRRVLLNQCERIDDLSSALRRIIKRGDSNLAKFLAEGTINQAQYERSLRASREARRDLGNSDCATETQLPGA